MKFAVQRTFIVEVWLTNIKLTSNHAYTAATFEGVVLAAKQKFRVSGSTIQELAANVEHKLGVLGPLGENDRAEILDDLKAQALSMIEKATRQAPEDFDRPQDEE